MSTFLCIVTSYVYSDELCSELYVFNKTMMAFGRPLIVVTSSNWEKDIELKFVFMFFYFLKTDF